MYVRIDYSVHGIHTYVPVEEERREQNRRRQKTRPGLWSSVCVFVRDPCTSDRERERTIVVVVGCTPLFAKALPTASPHIREINTEQ